MSKEEGSEISLSNLQDGADDEVQNKPLIKYRRNPRVLSSNDIKEEAKSSENSDGDGDNQRISSTSGFIEAAHDHKPEIIPFKKRSSYTTCQDDNLDPQSQPATRESGGKLSPIMSAGEEHCEEKITGDENLVKDAISTKIHDDDAHSKTTGSTPQGGGDYNDTAPNIVGDGEQAHNTKHDIGGGANDGCLPTDTSVEKTDENSEADCHEQVQQVAIKDGVDESGFNSVPEEEGKSKSDKKPVGYFLSLMMDDGDVPDQLTEFEDNGGNNSCLLTDHTTVESKNGKPVNDANTEGSNNTAGGEELQKKGGKKPMEIDMSVIIHDGGSSKSTKVPKGDNAVDVEQVHLVDLVTKPEGGGGKGKDIADAVGGDTPSSIDNNTSGYILAQGQQDSKTIICGSKRSRSTNEQGEVTQEGGAASDESEEQARKIFKSGSDGIIGSSNALGPNGGIGHDEPPVQPQVQQATRRIQLFGFDISCEPEHNVPIIGRNGGGSGSNQAAGGGAGDGSRPMTQPIPGIRLFGVDISGDQVQPAATGNNDGGSSSNR
ncbi:hypothetical protein L6452_16675 [Arctium lappa]|uniref:Uncharacterized protein n=1 Tax=Arctium lappa TaxID=4217 RepID=A0ACB9C1A7_ARCLA|nr:hypothetical protein L6452_16675 [Arctium lappa]